MSSNASYDRLFLFIAGEWIGAEGRETQPVINPATGETLGYLPLARTADLDRALEATATGFSAWRRVSAYERSGILRAAAALIRERRDAIALQTTLEQGKPLAEARSEIQSSADIFDWFADEGRRTYGRTVPARAPGASFTVTREPVGPVAAFTPWNFPASQAARKIAASLAAGCSCIIKPSEETPATALALARALDDAGLPRGVLNVVFGVPRVVSAHLIGSPIVRNVSFTGSTAVGKLIGKLAAQNVTRTTLELGGHAPVLVFADADLERTIRLSVSAKYRNAGQTCISPTRFYIHESLHDRFVDGFAAAAAALTVGNGLDPSTQMGPMANARRIDAMETLTANALAHGAHLVTGGSRFGGKGYFWQPTLLSEPAPEARIMSEEPFGPVAVTRRFTTVDEALAEANRLPYGLAAYTFTRSMDTANIVSGGLESGMVGLNTFTIALPEIPFGGVKESGHGSEGGSEGLGAYLVTKLVSQEW